MQGAYLNLRFGKRRKDMNILNKGIYMQSILFMNKLDEMAAKSRFKKSSLVVIMLERR
jgi:hypothetical protein